MNSPPAVLTRPQPRYRSAPQAVASEARRAIDLAALAGIIVEDWQAEALEDALGVGPDGRWAAREVAWVVPRQNGKNVGVLVAELMWLFLTDDRLITHSAHVFNTARDHFRELRAAIENTPELNKRVKRNGFHASDSDTSIELKDGSRIKFMARAKGSGRGLSGDKVVLDEAMWLWDDSLASMMPSLSARPNPQIWYTSSAPIPGSQSEVLRRTCARGRRGSPSMAYLEYSAEVTAAVDDRSAWHDANPALGGPYLSLDAVEVELAAMKADDFAAERLGIWREDEVAERLIPADRWDACAGTVPMEDPVTFGIEVGRMRDGAAIVAAGGLPGGGVGVEVVDQRPGVDWLIERIIELHANQSPRGFVVDPRSQAGKMLLDGDGNPIASLAEAGVTVTPCDTAPLIGATADFFQAITEGTIQHLSDPDLDAAVAGATKRDVGDAWLWDRKSGETIWTLVAATLARWGHLLPPEEPAGFIGVEWR